ncbi:MAG TPA: acyl-CoA dehydrogenase family protein, partial [Rhodopila sp.]|nr:acyl-CoA dehydrogenase family protein [Rhodopila sp.]
MPDSITSPVSPDGDTMIIDMIRRFSQERLAPLAAEREKSRRIEPEVIAELGELGVFGATTPTQWDGSEIDPVTYAMLVEEIAAGDGSVSTMVSVHNSPTCIVINDYGTDAQKDRWLRKLATAEHV